MIVIPSIFWSLFNWSIVSWRKKKLKSDTNELFSSSQALSTNNITFSVARHSITVARSKKSSRHIARHPIHCEDFLFTSVLSKNTFHSFKHGILQSPREKESAAKANTREKNVEKSKNIIFTRVASRDYEMKKITTKHFHWESFCYFQRLWLGGGGSQCHKNRTEKKRENSQDFQDDASEGGKLGLSHSRKSNSFTTLYRVWVEVCFGLCVFEYLYECITHLIC